MYNVKGKVDWKSRTQMVEKKAKNSRGFEVFRMKSIKLVIPMRIFPKPRPRQGKHGNFYSPRDEREKNLEDYFFQFVQSNRLRPVYPVSTNLRVDCIYFCKGLAPCDKDNADKTIGDCGEGFFWENDRQIKDGRTRFIENADKDSIEIIISERSVK